MPRAAVQDYKYEESRAPETECLLRLYKHQLTLPTISLLIKVVNSVLKEKHVVYLRHTNWLSHILTLNQLGIPSLMYTL